MPRKRLPPRLKLRKDRDGRKIWVIKDGPKTIRTGFTEFDAEEAHRRFAEYLSAEPDTSRSRSAQILIADVLHVYIEEKGMETAQPKEMIQLVGRLNGYWGDRTVSEIRGATCRAYTRCRKTESGSRRDLEILRAACRYYAKEYGMDATPEFTLPDKSVPRSEYMKRDQVARFLRVCRNHPDRQHLVRLVLIGIYTGTRPGAILNLQWMSNTQGGSVDLEKGVLHRRGEGERVAHNKRRTPCKLPSTIIGFLQRWKVQDQGIRYVVHYKGSSIQKLNKAWRGAIRDAGLPKSFVPHLLRHTRGTWLAEKGVQPGQAAASLGITVEEYERTYLHNDPDFQKEAASAY